MQIETLRFGTIEIDQKKIVNFKQGLPGLDDYHDFIILQFEEGNPINWLQSTESSDICLPIINTFLIKKDYIFDIADDDVAELKIDGPEDIFIFSVIVVPESLEQMTANLAAPIIINSKTGAAKQILLSTGNYNVRHPIFAALCQYMKEDAANAGTVTEDK